MQKIVNLKQWLIISQDYTDIMDDLDSLKISTKKIENNHATVIIDRLPPMKMVYSLSKKDNDWLIDTFEYKWD